MPLKARMKRSYKPNRLALAANFGALPGVQRRMFAFHELVGPSPQTQIKQRFYSTFDVIKVDSLFRLIPTNRV